MTTGEDCKRAISGETDPEIIRQSYCQLAQVYRRMHQTTETQAALASFQKLKQQATGHQQQSFERKRKTQEQSADDPPATSNGPN